MYGRKVVTNFLRSPTLLAAQTRTSIFDSDKGHGPSFSSSVKVVDYPEPKPSLTDLLRQYLRALTFPGEPLGVTDRAVHHIRLKPVTKPAFIPAYRLLHSQRTVADNMVNDMLEQGVTQESHSSWNSPLFLVPKKTRNIQTGH